MYLRLVLFYCLAVTSISSLCWGAPPVDPPRLVVVISIDQFPFEYLQRMRRGFAEDGFFETVRRRGAVFANCHHGHAFTITGPGHSVLLTGAFPNTTGIIENDWYDVELGKTTYCVADESVSLVGAPGKTAVSPRNLLVGTLGDSLKLATNGRGKVFGAALKDRTAILMTGHAADGAYWYDANSGMWVTSTYYREILPDYLRAYNEAGRARRFADEPWTLLLPMEKYELYYPDNSPWEKNVATLGRSFPHPMPKADDPGYANNMPISPHGSEMTLEVAQMIVTEEKLGLDDDPDLLCINLSSNDYVGHAYGPYSLEVQDMTYRTDRLLGALMEFLNERVGAGRWTVALSSDHGVAPIPEHAVQMKLPARRVPSEHFETLRKQLDKTLADALGKLDGKDKYVANLDSNALYLNPALRAPGNERFATAQRIACDLLRKDSVVAAAFTRDDLLAGGNDTDLFRRMTLSFHPGRSGDVIFALKPYHIAGPTTASHGTPWDYDTHVPLLWYGAGITPGFYDHPSTPPQIAPTAARLLNLEAPSGCVVEPLYGVLGLQ